MFWVVLAGTGPKDLAVGAVTAVIAAWMSLQLLPPGELTLRPARALALFLRFLWQSVVAGVTVARIALSARHAAAARHCRLSHEACRPATAASCS